MTAFLALIRKDLTLFFLDPRAVIMAFAAPIVIGAFFGYVFGGATSRKDPGKIAVLVVDRENGAVSRDILDRLKAEKSLRVEPAAIEDAQMRVRKGSAAAAIVIPADFGKLASQAMFAGGASKPKIEVYYDPSRQAETGMIKGILTGHVMQAVSKQAFSGAAAGDALKALGSAKGVPSDQRDSLRGLLESVSKYNASNTGGGGAGGAALTIPFDTSEEALTAEKGTEYNPYAHSFAGMCVQFILFMGVDVGIGVLLQRQRGLWKRFRAAPLSKAQLLGSRAVSAAIVAMIIMSVVFLVARVVFGVRIEGSLPGFIAISATFGIMTATYGLLIAALGKTPEAARGLSIFGTILMVMLSGAWVPSFLFPGWMQNLTKLVPARWAVDGLDGVTWRGLGFADAMQPAAVLVGFALLFGTIAVLRFRWEE